MKRRAKEFPRKDPEESMDVGVIVSLVADVG